MDDVIGQLLGGRYRIVRGIGAGGMGGVYEAIQEDLGRRVAVKVIAEQLAGEPMFLERFRREAMAAAQLGHPNLVQVTDFQITPGEPPFMVMELLEGDSLSGRLKRGALEPSSAVDITLQILAGLHAAHSQGVVHRDLKPGNVFLTPLGSGRDLAKVLDFGIAKLMDSETYERLTQTGILVGTPRYAAPEQMMDSKTVDPRTDVYAAGLLLYCMLSGRPPYKASGARLLLDVQNKEPTDPRIFVPRVSPGLVAVMRRATKKSRQDRFQSVQDFAEALTPFAGDAAVDETAPAPAPVNVTTPMSITAPTAAPQRITVPSRPSRGAPPTRPTRHDRSDPAARPPEPTSPAPSIQAPSPAAPSPLALAPSDPTYVAGAPRQGIGVAAGSVIGFLLGLLVLGALGAGIWLGLHERSSDAFLAEPSAPAASGEARELGSATIPAACQEWERLACHCPNQDVVQANCEPAHSRIVSISTGGPSADCARLLEALRLECDGASAPAPPPQARVSTGIAECDEATRLACTCGPAGANRDARCVEANTFVTNSIRYQVEDRVPELCRQHSAQVETGCRENP